MKKLLSVCILYLIHFASGAQVNLDFEAGNFTGWTGKVGNTNIPGTITTVSTGIITTGVNANLYVPSYHTIMTGAGNDPFGPFPRVAPGGSYSVRLGNIGTNVNTCGGPSDPCAGGIPEYICPKQAGYSGPLYPPFSGAESIEQSFVVTSANALVTLQYAAVFNNGDHSGGSTVNPFFRAEVLNSSGASISSCLTYTFILNTSGLPSGAAQSPSSPCWYPAPSTSSVVVYMPWQKKLFDLTPQIGQTVTVKFTAGGCDEGGHFGYAYVDASAGPKALIQTGGAGCTGPVTLTGPTQYGGPYSWSGPAGGITASSVNSATVNTSGTYSMTVGTGPCAITFTTAVNLSGPTITATSANQSVCSGGNLPGVAFSPSPAGATINWTNTNTNVGLAASGSGDISAYTSPTVTTQQVAIVTATPTYSGCTGPAKTFTITINPYPNLSVSSNPTITCSSSTVSLSGSSSTPGTTYSWSPGGSAPTATTTNVSSAGSYTLTATVGSCSSSSVVTVNTNTTLPDANAGSAATITCLSNSVTLTGSSVTSGATYSWNPGGSTPTATSTSVSSGGTYSFIVTDPSNGCKKTATVSVSSNTVSPVVTTGSPGLLTCAVNTVNASATTTVSPSGYIWTGPGITSASNISTITVNQAGTYNYTVTDSNNGCKTTGTVSVTQNTTAPAATASLATAITCTSTSATLQGSPGSGVTYSWSGTGLSGGTTSAVATITNTGTFTLTTTSTVNSCTNTAVITVTVNNNPPQISINPDLTLNCTVTSQTLSGSSTTPGATFAWTGPTTGTPAGSTPNNSSSVVNAPGLYTLTVTDPSNGCTSELSQSVSSDTTTPNITVGSSQTITCLTTSVTLTGSSTTSGVTYSWTPGGSSPTGTVTTVTTGGSYTLTVINPSNNCTTFDVITVNTNTLVPTLTLTPSSLTTTCSSPTATLMASSSADPDASYIWTVPPSGSLNNTTVSNPVANGSGVFTVQVTNTVSGCVSAIETVTMTADANTPTLTATAVNTVICSGATTTLNITGADSYTWSTTETASTITVSPTGPATYSVIGTNTLSGCTAITNISVNVIPTPTINITTTATSVCEGNSTTLNLSGATSYTLTNPAMVTTGSAVVTPTTQTTYTVIGETSNCSSAPQTITINVNSLPIVSVSDQTTCAGVPTILTANGADTYTWSLGTQNTNTLSVTTTTNTTYTVSGTNTLTGCTSTLTTANVIVDALPTVTASANPNTTCTSGTVTLTANTTATTYTWTLGNGVTASNQNQSPINFPASGLTAGIYVYTVTVTSNNCVSAPATASITIIDVPSANFDLSDLDICQNNNGSISINTPQTGVTYDWNINGQSITNTNPLIVPASITGTAGTYTVSVVAGIGTCTNTANNTLTVNAIPVIALVNPTVSACENAAAQLDVANPNTTYSYAWQYNSQIVSTGPGLTLNPLTTSNNGQYTVTATDANGCINRTIGYVDLQICEIYIPEIFTPNGDGKNDGFVIRNIENYPDNKLKIFNRWGNLIYQKDSYQNEFEGYANTGDAAGQSLLPSGTYYVILEYGDGKTETYNGYLLLQY